VTGITAMGAGNRCCDGRSNQAVIAVTRRGRTPSVAQAPPPALDLRTTAALSRPYGWPKPQDDAGKHG
jgi:hypothetical protein